jgi:hypothetical protein
MIYRPTRVSYDLLGIVKLDIAALNDKINLALLEAD